MRSRGPSPRLLALAALVALAGCRSTESRHHTAMSLGGESCDECHLGAFEGASFDHDSVGYGHGCDECHTETSWEPTKRPDHDSFFPLRDAHATLDCNSCHGAGRDDPQPKVCIGCHATDKAEAVPSHATFPDDCTRCHAGAAWEPASFDHSILGAAVDTCIDCHAGDRFRSGTVNHAALPVTCGECHTTVAWLPTSYDHDVVFPLVGQHQFVACASCHLEDVFAGTGRDCAGCHGEIEKAPPPHVEKLAAPCEECHTPEQWFPSSYVHDPAYDLTGKHTVEQAATAPGAECLACHTAGTYAGTSQACLACHAADEARAVDPPHEAFADTCQDCHTTSGWSPATFDHERFFPLVGRHAALACEQCHEGGVYAGTPRDCIGCHADDKANTVGHPGLSDDCTECHGQDTWRPSTFSHRFVVPHGREVSACGDCHLDARDYGSFSCIDCHEHNAADTADRHRGIGDYSYTTAACYACHPRGVRVD